MRHALVFLALGSAVLAQSANRDGKPSASDPSPDSVWESSRPVPAGRVKLTKKAEEALRLERDALILDLIAERNAARLAKAAPKTESVARVDETEGKKSATRLSKKQRIREIEEQLRQGVSGKESNQ